MINKFLEELEELNQFISKQKLKRIKERCKSLKKEAEGLLK